MPTTSIPNRELISFLKSTSAELSSIDKLKVYYRPIVCPLNLLLDHVDDSNKVFDIGCGSGQFALLLAQFRNPKSIHGIEISEKLVANANQLLEPYNGSVETQFDYFDGQSIPDKVADFDTIFMIDVFHHIPVDIRWDFMKELCQKMSAGSRLIFKDINAASPLVYINKMHDLVFAREIGHEVSKQTMIDFFKSQNLTISFNHETRTLLYPHYTLIAQK